ncbi:MAG: transglycosylase SLT domain-containing protein [Devosiaceae bacterium]
MAIATPALGAQRFSPPNPVASPMIQPASSQTLPAAALPVAPQAAQAATAPLHTGSIAVSTSASAAALQPLIQALSNDQGQRAYSIAQGITDPATRDLGLWLIGRTRADDLPIALRTAFRDAFAGWPGSGIIARQTETAILAQYGTQVPPLSVFGTTNTRTPAAQLVHAQALAQAGQTQDARTIVSALWRSDLLEDGLESRLLSTLGSLLSQDDHRHRAQWLLYRDRVTGAERLAQYLTAADRTSIEVRGRAIRDGASARDMVRRAHVANPGDIHITYELARLYRRADEPREAARLLRSVSQTGDALVRPDVWWRERHIVARDLIELRQPQGAYELVQTATGSSAGDEVQRAFLAGWLALRYLNDPARAEPHFRQILEIGTTPITRARGYYWLGRTLAARGDTTGASQTYARAMTYGETFYGQAAATISGIPIRFEGLPNAQGSNHAYIGYADALYTMNRRTDARLFLYSLARSTTTPGQIVAMAQLAARHGDNTSVVQLGKIGALRYRSLALLGYPTGAFPQDAHVPDRLPRSVAYAISRQESGFDARVRSHAGALGLMQLMPDTARRIARDMGVSHSTSRLTSDPAHNVSLGAYHLDELIAEYNGSYILTFIAYNAGPRRVPQWIERFGDPRTGQVDVLDWIELIPFSETRSYVQRVLENIYVYEHITAGG